MHALTTLLEQAETQRNIALAAFNQALVRRDGAREQARELEQYRHDYTERWKRQFQVGAALEIVRSYHQFADRLELAITQQAQVVAVSEQALERANDHLAAHELRVASVRKLIARRQEEWRRDEDRRDQSTTDEIALRMAAARRNTLDGAPA